MNPLNQTLLLLALGLTVVCCEQDKQRPQTIAPAPTTTTATGKQNVNEEMRQITKSLEDLLGELAVIKREANGRLSNVKNRASPASDQERIRQTKVSRFVLRRVAELESESLSMREELAKLFDLQQSKASSASSGNVASPSLYAGSPLMASEAKQEDHDFDEPAASGSEPPKQTGQPTTTQEATSTRASEGFPAPTSTLKPDPEAEEAAKIGFDMEALKKLGEEIGKRLDQFGKEAAKNLGDLIEGVKLVFREPKGEKPKAI